MMEPQWHPDYQPGMQDEPPYERLADLAVLWQHETTPKNGREVELTFVGDGAFEAAFERIMDLLPELVPTYAVALQPDLPENGEAKRVIIRFVGEWSQQDTQAIVRALTPVTLVVLEFKEQYRHDS